MQKIIVLRWGHRPQRDQRLTTHVALTARVFGAHGFLLSDVEDKKIKNTIEKVIENWGGVFFFEMGKKWKKIVKEWKSEGGTIVHLTAYGENIDCSDVLQRIKNTEKNILIIVGSKKVPKDFFRDTVSDFNVAIGNQPHSECVSLAIFLDRYFEGKELVKGFENSKIKIIPQKRGKKIIRFSNSN
jgi:tRNA (cytidine56-2'-O)-methyltransferase